MEKKIVINSCYGGFSLSYAGTIRYAKHKGIKLFAYGDMPINGKYTLFEEGESEPYLLHYTTKEINNGDGLNEFHWSYYSLKRDDPALVKTVEDLKERAHGRFAQLTIVSIPEDVAWEIEEYDGIEWVAEKHRTWS